MLPPSVVHGGNLDRSTSLLHEESMPASPQLTRGSYSAHPASLDPVSWTPSPLSGKRVAMVTFSAYPGDPRPRRAAEALIREGMQVDVICLREGRREPRRAIVNDVRVLRIPLAHRRGGALSYAYSYSAFLFASGIFLAARTLKRKYDLVHVHNMPDILVLSSLIPKAFGAKVILDMHDPMPELMTTIFGCGKDSVLVRLLKRFETWSMAQAHCVVTVNEACKRIFSSRSCRPEKIGVVMNTPDEVLFSSEKSCAHRASDGSVKPFVIMYHGTLVERNGLDLAVEALSRVREVIPTAELRIYGRDTPFLETVINLARRKQLLEYVHFLGPRHQEDLVREIEDCDVGVIPNHKNAFTEINTPTRIFEYLALGKPVIAPRTPGILDYFGPESLFFFEPGNCEELAERIAYVFSHPSGASEAAERGRQVYFEHTWSRERQKLVGLVSAVLESGKFN
jgi:glycosyltransferase involved in cell wall biosynthesis